MLTAAVAEILPLHLLDYKIFDAAVQRAAHTEQARSDADLVLVVIDERSLQEIPEPLAYWQPHVTAVLKALSAAHARAIGLDMVFTAKDQRAISESKQLAQVFAELNEAGTPVILGYDAGAPLPQSPLYMLAGANSPRPLGYLNLPADEDDFVRRFDPCQSDPTEPAFSLGAKVASSAMVTDLKCGSEAMEGKISIPLDERHSAVIPFGRVAQPKKTSFAEVLATAKRNDSVALEKIFAGKIVLIGSEEIQDRHATPLLGKATGRMPGIEIHAAIAQSIYSGIVVRRISALNVWSISMVIALFAATAVLAFRWQISVAVTIAAIVVSIIPAFAAWNNLAVFPASRPLFSALFAGAIGFTYRYRTEFVMHRRLRGQFAQYVSPEIVEQIIEHGVELGGTRRRVTVLFSDIRGFTTLSEKVPAEDLVKQLNEYLSAMSEIIIRNGGYLDKFIGDGILAIYGAPVEQPDAAWKATLSAVEMLERLAALNTTWKGEGRTELKIGIGIHSGEAIVGNMGSARKLEYTAVGDTVNTASRIESKTKDSIQKYGVHILISGATADELERLGHLADIAPMESELLKGKSEVTELFMLRGLHGAGKKGVAANA